MGDMTDVNEGKLTSQRKRELLAALLKKKAGEPQQNWLSYGQKALWFLQINHPSTYAYNAAYCLRILSSIQIHHFKQSFQLLVDRHPMLRTTYRLKDGEPVQVTAPKADVDFHQHDISGLSPVQIDSLVQETYRIPFDLENGPVARVHLFTQSDENHILLINIHHIACDAWSIWVLMNEFRQIYPALCNGVENGLPALHYSYFDFVQWQKGLTEGREGDRLWEFWHHHLNGDIPVLDLPTLAPYPPVRNYRGASAPFRLSSELVEKIHACAREQGATLYMALLAVFNVLLHRYTGQSDIIVGSPTSGRTQADFASLVGYFVNPVALRSSFEGDPLFSDYLSQVRHTVLDALTHQDYPLPLLVERMRLNRDQSRTPLFQAMFILQKPPQSDEFLELMTPGDANVHWGGLNLQPYELPQMEGQFDLTLEILEKAEQRDGLFGVVKYNTDVLDDNTIRRMQTHYRVLLESIVENPNRTVSELPILSANETGTILNVWNDTTRPYPLDRSLHHWIEEQAERTPHAVAVEAADESRTFSSWTYDELNRRANRLAHYLRNQGVGRDTAVGICAERSLEMVLALLATIKAGGAYVPLEPSLPKKRLQYMMQNSELRIVITQQKLLDEHPDLQELTKAIELTCLVDDDASFGGLPETNPPTINEPGDLAYIIYTSGSTGRPKGAMNTHRAVCNRLLWMQEEYQLTQDDRVLQKTPYSFDVSVWEFFWPLMTGARLVMAKPEGHKDNAYLADTIRSRSITTLHFVPSMLKAFLEWDGVEACRSLRRVICSGESLTVEIQNRFFERLDCELYNLYGPTEAAIDVTYWPCRRDDTAATVPIGYPIANTRIHILDSRMQPVPIGVSGELYIGGAGLARGYINNPDMTRERFIPDPFSDDESARLYKTGDLARYRADGTIEYIGRTDFQEKIRGFRIELGEIEAALERHENVREAVVISRDDRPGGRYLAAYLVMRDGCALDSQSMRRFLSVSLPDYMVPSAFVVLESLPKLHNGKLDRSQLPAPDSAKAKTSSEPETPRSEIEAEIQRIWQDVLERDGVGLHENFFEAGGHSLLLGRVQKELQARFDRDLTMVELFQYPTIHSLADHLGKRNGSAGQIRVSKTSPVASERAEIAVVGMAGRFPGAESVDAFWQNLCDGVESISFFSRDEMIVAGADPDAVDSPNYVNAFGTLEGVERFDAPFFGITTREAEVMDAQHRIFLECAWDALEHAGCNPDAYEGRIGVFAGTGLSTYLLYHLMPNLESVRSLGEFQALISNDKDYLPSFTSYKLNLKGPSVSIQTACSTSLVSIHYACRSLQYGECDMALAGGVSIHLPQRKGYLYNEGMILSPDGHCRAFDAEARGTVGGDGAGIVALKRLEDALRDGDTIHAVIAGSAINNDGSLKAGYTAPSVEGQADVIRRALESSGLSSGDIGYIETHGTGTVLGDPIEIQALQMAYGERDTETPCAIGSVKTNVGHLDAAAGVTGFIKAVLSVEKGEIPPTLHYHQPNPQIDFSSTPFYVNAECSKWESNGHSRCAAVSSFGIGGTNAHVILKQALAVAPTEPIDAPFPLPISAKTGEAFRERVSSMAEYFHANPNVGLGDASFTLCAGRKAFECRGFALATASEEAADRLRDAAFHQVSQSDSAVPVSFLFPGQGAQHAKMGHLLYQRCAVYRENFDLCCELLEPHLGGDLCEELFTADANDSNAERLMQTAWAQPALFAVEYSLAQLWMSLSIHPAAMIGHSIGEYTAACLAGVFSLEDALRLVAIRGRLMQQAPAGAMLAVAVSEEDCQPYLNGDISLAVVNGPGRCVLAGPVDAIETLEAQLTQRSIQTHRLKTSHAFHSPMMETAAKLFEPHVASATRHAPNIPFVSNLTGTWITAEQAVDPHYWRRQLRETVRFGDGLKSLVEKHRTHAIEAGPGNTLISMTRRPDFDLNDCIVAASLPHPASNDREDEVFLQTAGALWTRGTDLKWNALFEHGAFKRIPLPAYPFQRKRYWIDAKPTTQQRVQNPADATPQRLPNVSDWLYRPAWIQHEAAHRASSELRLALCFVPNERPDCAMHALVQQFNERDVDTVCVFPADRYQKIDDKKFTVNPASREDLRTLLSALAESGFTFQEIVHGWLLEPGLESVAKRERGFYQLIALAQALADEGIDRELSITSLTRGAATIAGECLPDPDVAMVMGAVRTIPLEYPQIQCRCIDDWASPSRGYATGDSAHRIADEIMNEINERLVVLRGDARWIQDYRPLKQVKQTPAPVFRKDGVYLITGGLGGVGLAMAKRISQTCKAKLLLTGRSAFPDHDEWPSVEHDEKLGLAINALLDIETSGSEVLVLQANAANESEMRDAFAKAELRFGSICGVIHAAGSKPTGVIQRKDRESMDAVMQGKADGARVLLNVLHEKEIDFIALCSSLATVIEEIGQADYLAANAYLEALAENHPKAIAIDWDTWNESGMAVQAELPEELRTAHQERLNLGLNDDEGFEVLNQCLSCGVSRVVVSTQELSSRRKRHFEQIEAAWKQPSTHSFVSTNRDIVAPRSDTEQQVCLIWRELFGIDEIGINDDFFALGGHSLLATQALSRIRNTFHIQLTLDEFFQACTIEALAQLIASKELEQANDDDLNEILAELSAEEESSIG